MWLLPCVVCEKCLQPLSDLKWKPWLAASWPVLPVPDQTDQEEMKWKERPWVFKGNLTIQIAQTLQLSMSWNSVVKPSRTCFTPTKKFITYKPDVGMTRNMVGQKFDVYAQIQTTSRILKLTVNDWPQKPTICRVQIINSIIFSQILLISPYSPLSDHPVCVLTKATCLNTDSWLCI